VGLLIKEERKNKVEPYGKKEKFKIRIKLPKFWWLVAGWIIFALFGGIFRGTDDMPDYMTTIDDKGNNIQDPSLYQEKEVDPISNQTRDYYSPSGTIGYLFDRFPTLFLMGIGIGLAIPLIMVFSRSFRRW